MRIRIRGLLVFASLCGPWCAAPVLASHVNDSLRYVLDSDASAAERAKALCKFSERQLISDPAGALAHASNALRIAEIDGGERVIHEALCALRTAQFRLGLVPEHIKSTMRAADLSRAIGDPGLLSADLQELSKAYHGANRLDEAVEHARQALAIRMPTHDRVAIAAAERFLLEALFNAGRYEEIVRSAERAFANAAASSAIEQARLRRLVARALMALNKHSDALPHLAQAGHAIESEGDDHDRFNQAIDMAQWAAGTGRMNDGRLHLQLAERLSERLPGNLTSTPLTRVRYQLALAAQDWRLAHDLLQAIAQQADSAHRSARESALAGIMMVHELDARERERNDLAAAAERTEAQLTHQVASNRTLIAALAGLAILSAALLMLARRHQRSAKRSRLKSAVIERQKEEIHARSLELQRQNMRLAETLMREERHGLALGEMHHRLKNNLQTIDGLLQMQSGALSDPAAERVLREARGRLCAMALVHQSIYRLGDDSALPIRDHLQELSRNVIVAYGRHDRISVVLDADPIELHASDMLPLSLIVNELLTNSLKHAIAPDSHGSIRIVLRRTDSGLELRYCDHSAPAVSDLQRGTFGMELMQALAEQLNGRISIQTGLQTTYALEAAPDSLALRKAS